MGIQCQVIKTKGEIVSVKTKDGVPSDLYLEIVDTLLQSEPNYKRELQRLPENIEKGDTRSALNKSATIAIELNDALDNPKKQEKVLLDLAQSSNVFISDPSTLGEFLYRGDEAIVYKKGNFVYKSVDHSIMMESPLEYIDRVTIGNHLFPNSKSEIIGFSKVNGDLRFILKQPYIEYSTNTMTQEEIDSHFTGLGYINEGGGSFHNQYYVMDDMTTNNVVRGENGDIYVVDSTVLLNTPEEGFNGKMKYQPTGVRNASKGIKDRAYDIWTMTHLDDFKAFNKLPLNKKGEPSVEAVNLYTEYIKYKEYKFTPTDKVHLHNFIDSIVKTDRITSIESLKSIVEKTFIENGKVVADRQKLKDSGLYSDFEIENLISGRAIENIKEDIYKVLYSPISEIDINREWGTVEFKVPLGIGFLGKTQYRSEESLNSILDRNFGGIKTKQDFDTVLENMQEEDIRNFFQSNPIAKDTLFNRYKNTTQIPVLQVGDGLLAETKGELNMEFVSELIKEKDTEVIEDTLQDLIEIMNSPEVETMQGLYPEVITSYLESLEGDLAEVGIDVVGIAENYDNYTIEELTTTFRELQTFFQTGTNTDALIETLDGIVFKDKPIQVKTIKDNVMQGYEVVYLNTSKNRFDLYKDLNLIEVQPDTFVFIDTVQTSEILAQSFDLNLNKVREERGKVPNLQESDLEAYNQYLIYSDYFNVETSTLPNLNKLKFVTNKKNPKFARDFYITRLQEKQKNSELYKQVYSNFEISDGIVSLKKVSDNTIEKIKYVLDLNNTESDLFNYAVQQKQGNLDRLIEGATDVNMLENVNPEVVYYNYPELADNIESIYQKQGDYILTTNKQEFIKEASELYKKVEESSFGNVYQKIPTNTLDQIQNPPTIKTKPVKLSNFNLQNTNFSITFANKNTRMKNKAEQNLNKLKDCK